MSELPSWEAHKQLVPDDVMKKLLLEEKSDDSVPVYLSQILKGEVPLEVYCVTWN